MEQSYRYNWPSNPGNSPQDIQSSLGILDNALAWVIHKLASLNILVDKSTKDNTVIPSSIKSSSRSSLFSQSNPEPVIIKEFISLDESVEQIINKLEILESLISKKFNVPLESKGIYRRKTMKELEGFKSHNQIEFMVNIVTDKDGKPLIPFDLKKFHLRMGTIGDRLNVLNSSIERVIYLLTRLDTLMKQYIKDIISNKEPLETFKSTDRVDRLWRRYYFGGDKWFSSTDFNKLANMVLEALVLLEESSVQIINKLTALEKYIEQYDTTSLNSNKKPITSTSNEEMEYDEEEEHYIRRRNQEPPKPLKSLKQFELKLINGDEVKLDIREDEYLTIIYIHGLDFSEYGLYITKDSFINQMRITPLLFLEMLEKGNMSITLVSNDATKTTLEVKFFNVVEKLTLQVLPDSMELLNRRITKFTNKMKILSDQNEELKKRVNKLEETKK